MCPHTEPDGYQARINDFLSKVLRHGIEARRLFAAQAAGTLVIIPSADAVKVEVVL